MIKNTKMFLVILGLSIISNLQAGPLSVIVPAYFYPSASGSDWDLIGVGLDAGADIVTIMNPASGPGTSYDVNYENAVDNLRLKGGLVIGYVPTTYSARPVAQVKADIDQYVAWYDIDGIFLDETLGDGSLATLQYYSEIYHYIKSNYPGFLVVGNAGNDATDLYLWWPVVDVLVTFEGYSWDYYPDSVPSWRWTFSEDCFAMIVHSMVATPSEYYVNEISDMARNRNTRYVYITDETYASNPFDQLPSFWWELMYDVIYR
ncbi:spherulation-specific family 4 protein [Cerasicoccus fimbriatus]|uniref:spherulation-specific family 4 protein n=1 Tax=Cerasicoccus fimbriatus TaxID=3014554 RepID=UPI0022B4B995|nr:spherulation-specific family 4 protein [Cerasicoccus sp. TK19100]